MRDPIAVAVSPDGANVYVAGSYSYCVVVFDRDLSDGTLTFSQSICRFSHFGVSGSLRWRQMEIKSMRPVTTSNTITMRWRSMPGTRCSWPAEVRRGSSRGDQFGDRTPRAHDVALTRSAVMCLSRRTSLWRPSSASNHRGLRFIDDDFTWRGGGRHSSAIPDRISADGLDLFMVLRVAGRVQVAGSFLRRLRIPANLREVERRRRSREREQPTEKPVWSQQANFTQNSEPPIDSGGTSDEYYEQSGPARNGPCDRYRWTNGARPRGGLPQVRGSLRHPRGCFGRGRLGQSRARRG